MKKIISKTKIGVLTRVEATSSSGHLRTDSIKGAYPKLPHVGESFTIYGKPIVEGAIGRIVTTSSVARIIKKTSNEITFKTATGSTYNLIMVKE